MSYRFKNRFYRLLRLDKEARGAIKFYNQIKYFMIRDLLIDESKKRKREKK